MSANSTCSPLLPGASMPFLALNMTPTDQPNAEQPSMCPARALDGESAPAWIEPYLAHLSISGNKTESAEKAGISLRLAQLERLKNEDFCRAEIKALTTALDMLEAVMAGRAMKGDKRTRTHKDGSVSEWVQFDTLLQLRLAERLERGTWVQRQQLEHSAGAAEQFPTAAARSNALAEARVAVREAINSDGAPVPEPAAPLAIEEGGPSA